MSNANIIRSATSRAGQLDPGFSGEAGGLVSGAPGDPSLESGFSDQLFVYEAASQSLDDLLYSSTSISSAFDKQASFDTLLWDVEPSNPEGTGPQTPDVPPGTGPETPDVPPGTGPQTPDNPGTGPGTTPPTGPLKEVGSATPPPMAAITKAEIIAAMAAALGVSDAVVASKPPAASAALAFDTSGPAQTTDIMSGSLLLASPDPLGLF